MVNESKPMYIEVEREHDTQLMTLSVWSSDSDDDSDEYLILVLTREEAMRLVLAVLKAYETFDTFTEQRFTEKIEIS